MFCISGMWCSPGVCSFIYRDEITLFSLECSRIKMFRVILSLRLNNFFLEPQGYILSQCQKLQAVSGPIVCECAVF